jgi:hypothetical protein
LEAPRLPEFIPICSIPPPPDPVSGLQMLP